MKIEFEHGGVFITARDDKGAVVVRCQFKLTDCRPNEPLDVFTNRHGGPEATSQYLQSCLRKAHAY